jgi:hypothetical protein
LELKQALSKNQQENLVIQKEFQKLQTLYQNTSKEANQLKTDKSKLEVSLAAISSELKKLEESNTHAALVSAKKEKEENIAKLENLKAEKEEQEKLVKSLKEAVEAYNEELECQAIRMEDLRKANKRLQEDHDSLEKTLGVSVESVETLKEENAELLKKIEHLSEISPSLHQMEVNYLTAQLSELQKQYDDVLAKERESRKLVENDLCDMTLEKEKLMTDHLELKSQLQKLNEQSDDLRRRLKAEESKYKILEAQIAEWKEKLVSAEPLQQIGEQYTAVINDHALFNEQLSTIIKKLEQADKDNLSLSQQNLVSVKYQELQKDYEALKDEMQHILATDEKAAERASSTSRSSSSLPKYVTEKIEAWCVSLEQWIRTLGLSSCSDVESRIDEQLRSQDVKTPRIIVKLDVLINILDDHFQANMFAEAEKAVTFRIEGEEKNVAKTPAATSDVSPTVEPKPSKRRLSGAAKLLMKLNKAVFHKPLSKSMEASQMTLHGDEHFQTSSSNNLIVNHASMDDKSGRLYQFEENFARIFKTVLEKGNELQLDDVQKSSPRELADKVIDLMGQMHSVMMQQNAELEERDHFVQEQARKLEMLRNM